VQDIMLDVINRFGYAGVFLLIMVENLFPPIPSEVILTFGGFMTTYTDMNVWIVIAVATLGSALGAVALYLIGRLLSAAHLERLFEGRIGRLLHLKISDVNRAERWFQKHGSKAVFFCRFVPIVRSLISVPAGMAKAKPMPFLLLTVAGTFIWNTVLIFLGRVAGDAWESIAHYVDTYSMIALAVLVIVVLGIGAVFIKRRFLNQKD
jgi:Uncharacterized membrane-associated protein